MAQFAHHVILGCAFALQMAGIAPVFAQTPAPETPAQEEAFLDILPKVVVPDDVQRILGAVNEEFRNCKAVWPEEYEITQKTSEARALRDIYGLIRVRNVIETRDCSCKGKVANWENVETVAAALRVREDVERLGWQLTKTIAKEAAELTVVAETMCGGSF